MSEGNIKRVYFVRHGEAEGNVGHFSQNPQTPLTALGKKQATVVAGRFTDIKIDLLLASDMVRAQETAKAISEHKDLEIETSKFFYEVMKPSSFYGLPHSSEEYLNFQAEFAKNYSDPDWQMQDAENFQDIFSRVEAGVDDLERRDARNILVVSHGRLLRFLVSYLIHQKELSAETEYLTAGALEMTNTGITLFEFKNDHWKLITWNDHAHFAE